MGQRCRKKYVLHARDRALTLGEHTRIMGVVNVTPDSFSHDGCMAGRGNFHQRALAYAERQIRDGADIVDIGGESTRPGAARVGSSEERRRIIPVVEGLARKHAAWISVDTNKAEVAAAALDAGADVINTIKGTAVSTALVKRVARHNAAIILMHMGGSTPRTMQRHCVYVHLMDEIVERMKASIEKCLEFGIKSDKIIIDPGIGFGKTAEQNLEILNRLRVLRALDRPILVGTSRKSFIGKVLAREVSDRLIGTAATVAVAITHGAHLVRVHDVAEMKEIAVMTDAIITERHD